MQASLRYFGGLPALLRRLRAALAPLGHELQFASAPTAQGAALLARGAAAGERHCADPIALQRALARRAAVACSTPGASIRMRCRAWACARSPT